MITALPASTTFTQKQALLSAMEFADSDNLQDVLIVGYDGDGRTGLPSKSLVGWRRRSGCLHVDA